MNSNKLDERIEILEKESEEIEILAVGLIKSARLNYSQNLTDYELESLPVALINLRRQVITKYNTWYNSVYLLIERYLPHQLEEFKNRYKSEKKGTPNYGITKILELNEDFYAREGTNIVEEFRKCFTYQKSQLLSLKNIIIEDPEGHLSSLYQLEESLVQNIYDYLLKSPAISDTKSRTISVQKRKAVKKGDNYTCQICEEIFPEDKLEVDHIFPHSLGGSNQTTNLMALCRPCNENKSNRLEYYKDYEGKQKLLQNIREFVNNLRLISNFSEWLMMAGDARRNKVLLKEEEAKEFKDNEEELFEDIYIDEEEPRRPNLKVIETYLGFLDDPEMSTEDLHDRFRTISWEVYSYSNLKDINKEEKEIGEKIIQSLCKELSRRTERNLIHQFTEILHVLTKNDIFIETLKSNCLDTFIQLYKEKKYDGYLIELLDICGYFTNVEEEISQAIEDRNYDLLEKFGAIRFNSYKNEGLELVKFLNSKQKELTKSEDHKLKELISKIIKNIERTYS